jgi:hypothetical protein
VGHTSASSSSARRADFLRAGRSRAVSVGLAGGCEPQTDKQTDQQTNKQTNQTGPTSVAGFLQLKKMRPDPRLENSARSFRSHPLGPSMHIYAYTYLYTVLELRAEFVRTAPGRRALAAFNFVPFEPFAGLVLPAPRRASAMPTSAAPTSGSMGVAPAAPERDGARGRPWRNGPVPQQGEIPLKAAATRGMRSS